MPGTVSFAWKDSEFAGRFSAGVCLHGHTMHSEECLSFLPRYLKMAPGMSRIVARYDHVNFANAWWTRLLQPAAALRLEQKQIEDAGLRPFVSLTDDDNIEAPLSLGDVPVSVEWTVPYERSIFHLGIYNLPAVSAAERMARLEEGVEHSGRQRVRVLFYRRCAKAAGPNDCDASSGGGCDQVRTRKVSRGRQHFDAG